MPNWLEANKDTKSVIYIETNGPFVYAIDCPKEGSIEYTCLVLGIENNLSSSGTEYGIRKENIPYLFKLLGEYMIDNDLSIPDAEVQRTARYNVRFTT
jgi:hypothetical protein